MNVSSIVFIVIAALAVFAAVHFHLIAKIEAALHKTAPVANPAPVVVNVNPPGGGIIPPSESPVFTPAPPVITAPAASLPAGIDTPDANGFVALTGLPAGSYYSKIRFSIAEVGAALQGVQHASVALNSGFLANGRWITTQFIGVCAQIEGVTDGTTGAQTYRLKQPEVSIPGTLALPPSFTVASATAHFAALPDPNTKGSGGFVPGH